MDAPHAVSLRQLQYALAVAETGGFRKAAELCAVSQPPLSAQVGLLERRSADGHRSRRSLTASSRLRDPLAGILRVGVLPTISPYLLAEVAPLLRKRFPLLSLRWSEERTEVMLEALREGRLNAGLLARVPGMDGLAIKPICEEAFLLTGAQSHPLFRKKSPARLEELAGASLLLLEDGHCFRDQALAVCADGRAQEGSYRATSLATLARMAASTGGLTPLPALAVAVEHRNGELATRKFGKPDPTRSLVLAYRASSPLAEAVRRVAATMAESSAAQARSANAGAR